jgi:octaprenyl-diphosphate synthase
LDFDIRNYENKAVLGDLKSGYLNSFAVFLFAGLPEDRRLRAIQSQSLGELKSIVGEKEFADCVEKFDRINVSLIELYDHQVRRLEGLIDQTGAVSRGAGAAVVAELLPLSKPLYWRKK